VAPLDTHEKRERNRRNDIFVGLVIALLCLAQRHAQEVGNVLCHVLRRWIIAPGGQPEVKRTLTLTEVIKHFAQNIGHGRHIVLGKARRSQQLLFFGCVLYLASKLLKMPIDKLGLLRGYGRLFSAVGNVAAVDPVEQDIIKLLIILDSVFQVDEFIMFLNKLTQHGQVLPQHITMLIEV